MKVDGLSETPPPFLKSLAELLTYLFFRSAMKLQSEHLPGDITASLDSRLNDDDYGARRWVISRRNILFGNALEQPPAIDKLLTNQGEIKETEIYE